MIKREPMPDTPIEIMGSDGKLAHSFGGHVVQYDGFPSAFNAAGTPYATLRWDAADVSAEIALCEALEIYLMPVVRSDDFWSIEWRARPRIERHDGRSAIYCRLIVHKRSRRLPDAGILGVEEGYPSWPLPARSSN